MNENKNIDELQPEKNGGKRHHPTIQSREEPRNIDHRTGKLMTMHKSLHPKDDDVGRLYVTRKEGGRGHAGIEECIEATTQGFEETRAKKD